MLYAFLFRLEKCRLISCDYRSEAYARVIAGARAVTGDKGEVTGRSDGDADASIEK